MGIFGRIDTFITWFDGVVWGLPLIILILVTGIFLTVALGPSSGKVSWESVKIHGEK